ncbi:MAG: tRNA pseudouridine(55) synthase TruB [Chloroflexota bacterium]
MTTLRRTASGQFHTADAISLDALTADTWRDYLLPPQAAVAGLPSLSLTDEEAAHLRQGRAISTSSALPDGTPAASLTINGRLLGVVEVRGGQCYPRKMAPTDKPLTQ